MANDLEQKIIKQIEYYFGDINLPRDKFLQEKIKEDEGWITLDVLLTFKRLSSLSTDQELIAKAVEKSENGLVMVSEDRKKLRRNPEKPSPELNEERRKEIMGRTAYAKGFPLDEEFNNIITFLDAYGPVESCSRRSTKDHKFKGSCFIIFKDVETCKKFVEAESIKYGETELIRKFQQVYFDDKKKEIQDRKNEKAASKVAAKSGTPLQFPKGAIIHFSGIEEGVKLLREDLKEKVKEVGKIEVKFVDFNQGDLEGYLRFAEENEAVEFFKTVDNDTLEIKDQKVKLRVLEGDEEEEYLKKTSDSILNMRKHKKQNSNNRKRKGNFGGGRRDAKVSKRD
ncbi:la protein homolog [Diabrotica virgifera virgifera]|uniref:La protein homolog isoform X1 n=1 Tax=Diabrotica virgifera virgifera TaxID=50390 RepID=A0A6P7FJU5_DIAVI|nr:la protein homolog [Diabrotica virgifera virgifera]